MSIFFTKYNSEAMGGIISTMLDIFSQNKSYGTSFYTNESMFKYLEELKYFLGYRILPFSYCNMFSPNNVKLGLKNQSQFEELIENRDVDLFSQVLSNE